MKIAVVFFFCLVSHISYGFNGSAVVSDTSVQTINNVSAADSNNYVFLQWDVSNNHITDHFEIERMDVNGTFKTIALILSDNETETIRYSYKDKITLRDFVLFYRVKVVNCNGEILLSEVAPLKLASTGKNLLPVDFNPAASELKFHLPVIKGSYVCRFYNIVGKMVLSKTVRSSVNGISVNELKNGNYFLEIYHPQSGRRYYAGFVK
ncbi:MAG: T9SS type A sorting domain-containing protein [Lacibacter sp.]